MSRVRVAAGVGTVAVVLCLSGCGLLNLLQQGTGGPGIGNGDIWIDPTAFVLEVPLEPAAVGARPPDARYVPGQLIVEVREGRFTDATVNALCSKHGVQLRGRINPLRLILVSVPARADLEAARAKLALEPDVVSVGYNYVYELAAPSGQVLEPKAITNDPRYSWQWGLERIGYSRIPASVLPSSGPIIAVVDTGVDYTHPDLGTKVIRGPDYFDGDMDPMDLYGHGTHVAGIAAAITNNNVGVAGVSSPSRVLAVRVGNYWIPTFAAAAGIMYAANYSGVRVINLSWGGPWDSVYIRKAINYALMKGMLIVAAAGNWDSTDAMYPAAYQGVLAVGATDRMWDEELQKDVDVKTCWSNYGEYVAIAAPGTWIYSTFSRRSTWYSTPQDYVYMSGTSMAAPFVAGAAAVVWGKWPGMTRPQVVELLTTTGDPVNPEPYYPDCGSEYYCPCTGDSFPSHVLRLNLYNAFQARGVVMGAAGGAIQGIVVDATTGRPLAGATVTAIPVGRGTTRSTTSRSDGTYTIVGVPEGEYSLRAARSGFITTTSHVNLWVRDASFSHYNFALPVTQSATDVFTVVLTWDECGGAELDSYLWLPETNPYLVFSGQRGSATAFPFARLLRDEPIESPRVIGENRPDWWYFLVETTTFKANYMGTYLFAVQDYGWTNSWWCGPAVVRVYRGSTLWKTIPVTWEGGGRWWTVFTLTVTGTGTSRTYDFVEFNKLGDDFPGPYGEDLLY